MLRLWPWSRGGGLVVWSGCCAVSQIALPVLPLSTPLVHLPLNQTVEHTQGDTAPLRLARNLPKPGNRIHEMVSARMGRDAATSVLNGWCQAHDVPNLFITDGAFMTSSACQNPSLSYMAFSARAAHYAVDLLAQGAI